MIFQIGYDAKNKMLTTTPTSDKFPLPDKVYGDANKIALRVWNDYVYNNKSTGLLLTGTGGASKTLVSTIVCNLAIEHELPVYFIQGKYQPEAIELLINFLNGLRNCVIFLDEFGKMISLEHQGLFLTMLSDLNDTKKIFLMTENNNYSISNYIINRPGRVKYFLEFNKISESTFLEYIEDFNVQEEFKKDLIKLYNNVNEFTFDFLKAIINEHLKYPNETLNDIVNIVNVPKLRKVEFLEIISIIRKKDNKVLDLSNTYSYKKSSIQYEDYVRIEYKEKLEDGTVEREYLAIDFYKFPVLFTKTGATCTTDDYIITFITKEK